METEPRKVEICTDSEWLVVYGPLSELGHESTHQDEAATEWFSAVSRRLERELGVDTVRAQGQRTLCHGWNGANTFARKGSGLGTFDGFCDEVWDMAEEIACEEAARIVAEWQAAEVIEDVEFMRECIQFEDADCARSTWRRLLDYHGLAATDERIASYAAAVAELAGGELLADGSISFN